MGVGFSKVGVPSRKMGTVQGQIEKIGAKLFMSAMCDACWWLACWLPKSASVLAGSP